MRKLFNILIAISFFLTGCVSEKTTFDVGSIDLSADTLVFTSEGGIQSIDINSSGDWRISGHSDWVKPLAEKGCNGDKLYFEALSNHNECVEDAIFKIFVDNVVAKLTIRYEANAYIDILSSEKVELSSEESIMEIVLKTNISELDFDYSDNGSQWITQLERKDVFGRTEITFKINNNINYKSRESEITISGPDRIQAKVKVLQAKLDAVVTENPRIIQGIEAGEIELPIRRNVEYNITSELPEWLDIELKSKGETKDEDGLFTDVYIIKYGKSITSRITEIDFESNGIKMLTVIFKQQVENPTLFQISDPELRKYLTTQGLIVADSVSPDCELLEAGLNITELVIKEQPIKIIDGLGCFPNLVSLNFILPLVESIDLSDCSQIKEIQLGQLRRVGLINTGNDNPVESISFNQDCLFLSNSLEISGYNINNIDVSIDNNIIYYGDERLEILDVSDCPNLKSLNAKRELWRSEVLKTIYVSSAQKEAIDNNTLSVIKTRSSVIEVKE